MGRYPHAVLFPIAPQGHWLPFMQLLRELLDGGIRFTMIASQNRVEELEKCKVSGELGDMDIELKACFSNEVAFKNSSEFSKNLADQFESQKDQLLDERYTCLIADMFLPFTQDFADDLGIPRFTLFTSPAYFGLGMLNSPKLVGDGWHPYNEERKDEYIDIPGLDVFKAGDVPRAFVDSPDSYLLHSICLCKASGVIINTFEEYEPAQLAALRTQLMRAQQETGKIPKVYPIGPLSLLPSAKERGPSGGNEDEKDDCMRFLDERPKSSVLFICFGSQRPLPPSVIREIAGGLETSDVSFLWGLRMPPGISAEELLPPGFEARTKARGLLLTKWVPQKEVLLHSSTGAFISHCGWNSFLESMSGGVPIIAWPMWAEQHMNARFYADVLKVGVIIKGDMDGSELDGETFARTVAEVIRGGEGESMRQRMLELRTKAEAAVGKFGSSHLNIQALKDDLRSYV